jgi:hypothetical protein
MTMNMLVRIIRAAPELSHPERDGTAWNALFM